MAERKPLIMPNALPSDTLSRILSRDRHDSGRVPPGVATAERFDELDQEDVIHQQQPDGTASIARNIAGQLAIREEVGNRRDNGGIAPATFTNESPQPASKRELRRQIDDLSDTPLVAITLRIPSGINDWLDTYTFNHRKEGARKQTLIAEALARLILHKEIEE